MRSLFPILFSALLFASVRAPAQEDISPPSAVPEDRGALPPPQSGTERPVLGALTTPWLQYAAPRLTRSVAIAGSWSSWTGRHALAKSPGGLWELDTRTLDAGVGRHQYKFIVNGKWEAGANRVLPINPDGCIGLPPAFVHGATMSSPDEITVLLDRPLAADASPSAALSPAAEIVSLEQAGDARDAAKTGYLLSGDGVTFHFDQAAYGLDLPENAKVVVAGNFTGWDGNGGWNQAWVLTPTAAPGVWEGYAQLSGLRKPADEPEMLFKFVIDGTRWLSPPADAPNARDDGQGNVNLVLDPGHCGGARLLLKLAKKLDVTETHVLTITGIAPETVGLQVQPGAAIDWLYSTKPLGANLDRERGITTYRLFAPRAKNVTLCFFDRPQAMQWVPKFKRFPPTEEYRMKKDADGVWEISTRGFDTGRYYGFRADGPDGDGESFDAASVFGDPYARAVAKTDGLSIVIDPDATNKWFKGWTDQTWRTPPMQDLLIYECHLRGMTAHPSSKIPPALRGKFGGLDASIGLGTGIDHLKDLGVNAVELLPVEEYSESDTTYNWGYTTVYFFAPESDYATDPVHGSAYYELKQLVNDLHANGIAVIFDVVYNHIGGPNVFSQIDRKYYFRLTPDLEHTNNSGCGNDARTEAPMMRRLIVDNIRYFVEEFHADGFRFDLAELIDMPTMLAIRDAVRGDYPNVSLIAEPWSPGRGENKGSLRGTGWSAWNNDFRYAAKDFARGWANRAWLKENILGSTGIWAANPLQPVNYLESHDDMTLVDELSGTPDHDGSRPTPREVRVNKLAATVLFTSLGRIMIHEGQEFLRSKRGSGNSYNLDDKINLVDWEKRDTHPAKDVLDYYRALARLRMSPEGASFRVERRPPDNYYQFLMPRESEKMLGYIVNVPAVHAGRGFVVLLNSDETAHTFELKLPGDTRWRQIADGATVSLHGIVPEGYPAYMGSPLYQPDATVKVRVPAISSVILMNGF